MKIYKLVVTFLAITGLSIGSYFIGKLFGKWLAEDL